MDAQRRKKHYYQNNQKKRKQQGLELGAKGFLCTCNFREKDCVRDAYKLLNEFADELYGSVTDEGQSKKKINAKASTDCPAGGAQHDAAGDGPNKGTIESEKIINTKVTESDSEQDDAEDISTSLSKEISELKAEYAKPLNARRFQVVDTGVKNVVFIRSSLPNPLELVTKIVTELDQTKQQRTRYILRLLPIEVVCKAHMNDIKQKADAMLEKYFAQEPKTFSIVFMRHSNHDIQRETVIQDLAEIIHKKNPGNKVDLKNPELAVIVEVIRGISLISVAPYYYKYKKYNLLKLCDVEEPENNKKKLKIDESRDSEDEEDPKENETSSKEITVDSKESYD